MRSALKFFAFGAVAVFVAGAAFAQTTMTYTNSTPSPIPDVATMTSTITVPDVDWTSRDTTRDVNVYINLFHTWDSDLSVSLTGPDGTIIPLWSAVGGSSDGFDVTIDDEAASNINGISGTFRPQGYPSAALCKLDGLAPAGTYTLTIRDTAGGDFGTLNTWSITIEGNDNRFDNTCGEVERVKHTPRGLGSHANNGGGNGEDQEAPGHFGHGN